MPVSGFERRQLPGGYRLVAAEGAGIKGVPNLRREKMGLFDGLSGMLETAIAKHPGGLSGMLDDALKGAGGLDGVVSKLNSSGLGGKVSSWLGQGDNQPLTADEVRSALSEEHLGQIAAKLGIPADAVPHVLAQHLPNAVDQASPTGSLTAIGSAAGAAASRVGGRAV